MVRKVVFRPAASADLDELYDYIAKDSPGNALAFVRRIRQRCEKLAHFAEGAPLREDLRPGLRLLAFEKRAVIAYVIKEDFVLIGRIFYGGRDIESLVSRME